MQPQIEEIVRPADSATKKDSKSRETFPVSVDWVQNLQFVGTDERNHSIVMDANPEAGGDQSGPTPGRLLLMAVACCTAMDVVDILRRSRQNLTAISVLTRGVQNKDYPKYYTEIHLRYILKGKTLDKSRVERAIKLSQEKYCSVGATVSGKSNIFVEYEVLES
jgi:putative redox protein